MSKSKQSEQVTEMVETDSAPFSPNHIKDKLGVWRMSALALAVGIGLGGLISSKPAIPSHVPANIQAKIEAEFPQTKFVEFNQTEYGLIEAVTGKNIFYLNQDASALIVGELLDIDKKIPVTIERKRNLARFLDLDNPGGAKLASAEAAKPVAAPAPTQPQAPPARPTQIDITSFPAENYVVHNEGAGEILYVISDFKCGYCQRQNETLKNVTDIEIREIFVAFRPGQDSAIFASHTLCSDNPSEAAREIFAGNVDGVTTCSKGDKAVIDNTAWAQAVGINGTPALVTADGRVFSGARELNAVRAILGNT